VTLMTEATTLRESKVSLIRMLAISGEISISLSSSEIQSQAISSTLSTACFLIKSSRRSNSFRSVRSSDTGLMTLSQIACFPA
jgi:hypothetical protein